MITGVYAELICILRCIYACTHRNSTLRRNVLLTSDGSSQSWRTECVVTRHSLLSSRNTGRGESCTTKSFSLVNGGVITIIIYYLLQPGSKSSLIKKVRLSPCFRNEMGPGDVLDLNRRPRIR